MNARPLHPRRLAALAAALLLTTGLAACSSSSEADEPSGDAQPRGRLHAAPRLLPQRHPRAGTGRPRGGPVQEGPEGGRRHRDADSLQRRARRSDGPSGAARWTSPTSGPTRRSTPTSQSGGDAIRVIGGAASAGAALVVRPEINSAEDLKGKSFATPQLGNTQDVAFRYWLDEQGLSADTEGGGDVSIKPQSNSEGLDRLRQPARSTAPGCPSLGSPSTSRRARRSSWTRRPCGRTGSSLPRTSSCAPSSSRITRTS